MVSVDIKLNYKLMTSQNLFGGNPSKQVPPIFLNAEDNEELKIVSKESAHSQIFEESKCIETIDYNW